MNALGKLITQGYRVRAALARAACLTTGPEHEAAERLREQGHVILEGLLPPERVAAIEKINRGLFDYENAAETVFSPDGVNTVPGASVSREEYARHYFLLARRYDRKLDFYALVDPLISPILRAYYRSRYYYRELDCYRSQPVPQTYQGSYSWHRDNYPPGSLKVMVLLTDVVSLDDGPLLYAAGSQRTFMPELGHYGPRIPKDEVEGRLDVRPCLGRRGTVVLFDNNGIHRAANPTRGHREVLNALVLPSVSGWRPEIKGTDAMVKPTFLQRYTR